MLKAIVTSGIIKTIKAEITTNALNIISAEIISSVVGGNYPKYEGEYTVTPSLSEIELATQNKVTKENVVVLPIPVQRIENEYGGITVIIG